MRRHLLAIAAVATLTAGCGGDDSVGSDSAYATDTWAKPTVHGELDFDASNLASFSEGQRFHGWSFEVTTDADVVLETKAHTTNLNTVLYLYDADENGKKHGGYLFKNDNASDETMNARIARSLDPGHYFVQVKTTHVLQRGNFSLEAGCAGVGCPVNEPPSVADYCDSAEEDFGKCMDDSLDATQEECAPRGASAMLCCNNSAEWYCGEVCDPSNFDMSKIWNEDLDAVYGAFPEEDYVYLMDWSSYAVPSCASPELDDISSQVISSVDTVNSSQGPWQLDGWVTADDPDFFAYDVNEEVVTVLNNLIGEEAAARFSASAEIPCPNCTDGMAVNALYYPQVGKVVVLESRWGGDS
jgi:hypothetical protein